MNTTALQAVKKHVWRGFQTVGIMNGMPAHQSVVDEYTPFRSRDNTPITCIRESDGTEYWRHVGMGSV